MGSICPRPPQRTSYPPDPALVGTSAVPGTRFFPMCTRPPQRAKPRFFPICTRPPQRAKPRFFPSETARLARPIAGRGVFTNDPGFRS
jgi:hypothetical protein